MSMPRLNYLEANCRLAQRVAEKTGKGFSVLWYASDRKKVEVLDENKWTIFEGTPREVYIFLMGMTYFGEVDDDEALQARCERAVALAPDFWEK